MSSACPAHRHRFQGDCPQTLHVSFVNLSPCYLAAYLGYRALGKITARQRPIRLTGDTPERHDLTIQKPAVGMDLAIPYRIVIEKYFTTILKLTGI
jgi:hypothetical protein